MSRNGRLVLVALAVVVVAAAFVIARPGDDDDDGGSQASNTVTETAPTSTSPTATAPSAPKPPPDASATVITLTGHAAPKITDIEVKKGDQVRFVVRSDEPDSIHVHGYDIEKDVAPGKPARFSFPATIEGIFEIESHEAEHAGVEAQIAELTVEPS